MKDSLLVPDRSERVEAANASESSWAVVPICPLLADETCWFLAVDCDKKFWKDDIEVFVMACKAPSFAWFSLNVAPPCLPDDAGVHHVEMRRRCAGRLAGVHDEGVTGDVPRFVAGEIQERIGDIDRQPGNAKG